MVWKKIVERVAVSACPVCGNGGFNFEPDADIDDPHAMVKCGKCGFVYRVDEGMRLVAPKDN
jgi:rubredoxin